MSVYLCRPIYKQVLVVVVVLSVVSDVIFVTNCTCVFRGRYMFIGRWMGRVFVNIVKMSRKSEPISTEMESATVRTPKKQVINTRTNFERVLADNELHIHAKRFNTDAITEILEESSISANYVHILLAKDISNDRKKSKAKADIIYMIADITKSITMFLQFVYYMLTGYDFKAPWTDVVCIFGFIFIPFQILMSILVYYWTYDDDWRDDLLMALEFIAKERIHHP